MAKSRFQFYEFWILELDFKYLLLGSKPNICVIFSELFNSNILLEQKLLGSTEPVLGLLGPPVVVSMVELEMKTYHVIDWYTFFYKVYENTAAYHIY